MHVLARTDARTCGDGCTYLQGRMLNVGFSRKRLRGRLQCFASEMDKTGTGIASRILDKRKGRKDAPVAPRKYLLNRQFC